MVKFLCFRGNRVNIQAILEEFASFVFNAYYINVFVKFDDFFLTARERKSQSMSQLSKKFTVWKACNVFLYSETLVFFFYVRIRQFVLLKCFLFLHCIFLVRKSIFRKRWVYIR